MYAIYTMVYYITRILLCFLLNLLYVVVLFVYNQMFSFMQIRYIFNM